MVQPNVNIPNIIRVQGKEGLKIGRTPVWDWETNDFFVSNEGKILESTESTLLQIIIASIITEFGVYPIYGLNFGSEIHTLIGQDANFVMTRSRSMIKEALNDPRIASVMVGENIVVIDGVIYIPVRVTDIFGTNYNRNIRIG